jgi:uncharacterized Rmd1/YagE family protein
MLQLLKESVSSKHAERLEQIVIFLIGIEIGMLPVLQLFGTLVSSCSPPVLGIITILVDLMAAG